jgi:hypothetical protein
LRRDFLSFTLHDMSAHLPASSRIRNHRHVPSRHSQTRVAHGGVVGPLFLMIILCQSGVASSLANEPVAIVTGREPITFDGSHTISVSLPAIDLRVHPMVAVHFSDARGLTKLKAQIEVQDGNGKHTATMTKTMTPSASSQTAWYRFPWNNREAGVAQHLTLVMTGLRAHMMPPTVSFHRDIPSTRLTAFCRDWVAPISLHGLVVNQVTWPDFVGMPMSMVTAALWVGGCGLLIATGRIRNRPVRANLLAWSIMVLVILHVSLIPAQARGLARLQWMGGTWSDGLGPLPGQAGAVDRMLKTHRIDHVGVVTKDRVEIEELYFRYALLPVKVGTDAGKENTLLVLPSPGIELGEDGKLRVDGKPLLANARVLDATEGVVLVQGNRP